MATYYWVGGSGAWNAANAANWSASSGGAGGAGIPNGADTVVFDSGSGAAATVDVQADAAALTVTVNKLDINLSLSGSPTFLGLFTLTLGVVTLNSHTMTVARLGSTNTNSRTIDFGTGKIVLTANAARVLDMGFVTNLVTSGSKQIEANYSGGTGTREIFFGVNAGATEANALSVSVTAGSDIVNVTTHVVNLNFTGFSGTLSAAGHNVYGNITLSSTMTVAAGSNVTNFDGTSGTQTITSAGKVFDLFLVFRGGATYKLIDQLSTLKTLTLTAGNLDANGQNVSITSLSLGVGTKTLTIGSGTWSVSSTWNANTNLSGLTVAPSAGVISMTSASGKAFQGGGFSWPTLNQGGAGTLTIQQANTFANITNTVQPATITFPASTTTTVGAFSVSGTSGNLITINSSSAGTRATLSDASGTIAVSFASIKDINATGGATWNAFTTSGNIDAGNNLGWDFIQQIGRYIYTRRKNKRIL
jgi:hypothetical protein